MYMLADRTAYWEIQKPSMWEGKWEQITFISTFRASRVIDVDVISTAGATLELPS